MNLSNALKKERTKTATGFSFAKTNQSSKLKLLFWFGATGLIIILGDLLRSYKGGLTYIPLRESITWAVEWLIANAGGVFDVIKLVTGALLRNLEAVLLYLPWWSVVALIMLACWQLANLRVAIFSGLALYFIGSVKLWDLTMTTLSIVGTSVIIAVAIGVPLGILSGKSNHLNKILRPFLDLMQTMPAFVYLIPALMFFGIGKVPGVLATVIFCTPPAVRLTNLGIRQVPTPMIEVGQAFGCSQSQLLLKVQIPLALPSIMAGINQTIMLSLGMTVLSAMIAAGGLGLEVLMGLGQVDVGRGFVAGIAIVLVAMILDRATEGLAKKRRRLLIEQ